MRRDETASIVRSRVRRSLDGPRLSADSATMESHRRVSARLVFGVATVLGIFSAFQAYNYVSLFTQREPRMVHSFPASSGWPNAIRSNARRGGARPACMPAALSCSCSCMRS
jgi:hypothetical protein